MIDVSQEIKLVKAGIRIEVTEDGGRRTCFIACPYFAVEKVELKDSIQR